MTEDTKKRRGRPPRNEEVQLFSLRLPKDLHRALGLYVLKHEGAGSMNDAIVNVLKKWWAELPDRAAYERFLKS
jgi:predicted HicB family RNase H-like nuclease